MKKQMKEEKFFSTILLLLDAEHIAAFSLARSRCGLILQVFLLNFWFWFFFSAYIMLSSW